MSKTLATCTVLSLSLILFGINRGFDISDEGLYMLLANPDQENIAGIFNYDLFFKLFYKLIGIEFGIVGMRFLRLLSCLIGAISLTIFWRNLNGANKLSVNLFLLSLLGLFAGYGFLPQSLSYNSLTVVLACFWLALISLHDKSHIQYMLIGVLLACVAYTKITTTFGLGIITLACMLFQKDFKWVNLLALLLPFVMLELLMYLSIGDFALWRMIDAGKMMGNRTEYSFLLVVKYSAVGFFWLALTSIPFLISSSIDASQAKLKFSMLGLGLLGLVCISYYTAITQDWNHIVLLLTAAFFGYFLPKVPFKAISLEQRFFLLVLLILPFVLHFGSNVYWLRLSIHYWVFWMLAILYVANSIQAPFMKLIRAVMGLVILLVVANGIWIHPFEQEPLWQATQKWSYGDGNQILLSEQQVVVLSAIEPFVKDQEQLLAFYRIPGIPYLLGKTSPRSAGFWTKDQTEYFFPSDYPTELLIYYSQDSLPSFVKGDFSKKHIQLPFGEEIQILWRK
ncbi:hypothetical protein U3A58_05375 [Algoriphagus sp. C2-6-M1]|uniref:hypothetical protein n=1 Tax=Algoriphagus persicinus TaxID=3108754 RepID=UPI002B3C19C1|nr:hypothetical protein [Algoriphagus sp. C2-6-M1]MEB2779817.1 hypothetical protein [Algoriphagus sp. C2-6-M1]